MANNEEKDFAPPLGLTPGEQRAIETLYRAFSEQNPNLLDEAVASDWQDIPLAPGQGPGPDGLKPIIKAFIAAFPDIQITIKELIGVPGRAGVRAEITGTHKGEWFGIAPTGKTIRIPLHEFHHLNDGRITHTWHLEDWFGMLNQVGAWPPSATVESKETAR
ncbi:ester cyclase [Sorangium sp. So ce1078]|uniref:ester cyclase n=1 Tax=Sorangium sp. So ce1078 TaxID=3133329 RepID=UPI003F619204